MQSISSKNKCPDHKQDAIGVLESCCSETFLKKQVFIMMKIMITITIKMVILHLTNKGTNTKYSYVRQTDVDQMFLLCKDHFDGLICRLTTQYIIGHCDAC